MLRPSFLRDPWEYDFDKLGSKGARTNGAFQATEKAVLRTAGLVKRLLEFAQRTVIRLEPMDLNTCARKAIAILRQVMQTWPDGRTERA